MPPHPKNYNETYIRRKCSFKFLKNRKYWSTNKLSPLQTTWLLEICGKMLYLPKLILTIDGTIGYVANGTWCLDVRDQIGDSAGPYIYQVLMFQTHYVGPLCC